MAAALPVVLGVLGAASAAITVIKGLKEGNLFKAVLGGVGAYFAFSGLGAMTAVGQATSSGATGVVNAPAAVAGKATDLSAVTAAGGMSADTAMNAAMSQGLNASAGAGTELFTQGLSAGAGTAGGVSDLVTGGLGNYSFGGGAEALGSMGGAAGSAFDAATQSGAAGLTQEGGGGLLSQFDKFSKPAEAGLMEKGGGFLNKALGFVKDNPEVVKVGGQMISGWAQQKQKEEEMERIMKERERERRSRGASVSTAGLRLRHEPMQEG